jgi:hypothetical protein
MIIPKKKYRDKVRERLQVVHTIFLSDPEKLTTLMRRIGGFGPGSDFHNKTEAITILLERDIPALLDAFDQLTQRPSEKESS